MNALGINPFAGLIDQVMTPRRPRRHTLPSEKLERPTTKTGVMRDYLKQVGRATAGDLAIEADLDGNTGLVYALLKADISKGAISHECGWYVWDQEFDQAKHDRIQAAIRTLRKAGYTVTRETA